MLRFPFALANGNRRFQIDRTTGFGTVQKIPAGNNSVKDGNVALFDVFVYFDAVNK